MTKKAIVLGATGLVGANLVDQLSTAKHISSVTTVTRREMSHPSPKVSNSVVDFDKLADYSNLFSADLLFLCLGTTLKQAGSISAQRVVDFDYQLQAAQLAADQGVQHLLLVSSSGANAYSRSPYLKMKGELETQVKNLGFKHVSIFQPSLLLGDREQSRCAESIAALFMPTLCKLPGLQRFRPIQGAQVAQRMVEASAAANGAVQTYCLDQVFPQDNRQ